MAFPSIRSVATTNGTTATFSPVVNLPGTIQAGDTILVVIRSAAGGGIGFPSPAWTELADGSPDGSVGQTAFAWRKADGTEGTTVTLTSVGNGKFAAVAWAIAGATDPTIRPPEFSTVAVGTTGEPNATTVTPTGGAKDYLWLTFFTMEGEQTGITSYPTNYTLGQSGLANSGTGGAVTTNATAAGAARTNNAASEDAGVWDVTGTLDDSSAYTVAFHPAEPVPSELMSSREEAQTLPLPEPRLSMGMMAQCLAIPFAILFSIPPPQPPPGNPIFDVPITGPRVLVTMGARPQEDTLKPFVQHNWPNPSRPKTLLLTGTVTRPSQDAVSPKVASWDLLPAPRPLDNRRLRLEQLPQLTEPPPPPPGRSVLEVPAQPKRILVTVGARPQDDGVTAFAETEWPLPSPRPIDNRRLGIALERFKGEPVVFPPFAPADPLPPRGKTWVPPDSPLPPLLTTTLFVRPFVQANWPVPHRPGTTVLTDTETRPGPAAAQPVIPIDWPLPAPLRREPSLTKLEVSRPFYYTEPGSLPPGAETPWVVPEGRGSLATLRTWTRERPFYITDLTPASQTDWRVPVRASVVLPTIGIRPGEEIVTPIHADGQACPLFPNPDPRPLPTSRLTWTGSRFLGLTEPQAPPPLGSEIGLPWRARYSPVRLTSVFYYTPVEPTAVAPPRQDSWPLPERKPATLSLRVQTQSFPLTLTGPVAPPFIPVEWTVPRSTKSVLLIDLSTEPGTTEVAAPVRAVDWPLPIQRPAPAITLRSNLFYYVLLDLPPFRPEEFSNPLVRRPGPQVQTWTQNLLESTLSVPPAVPPPGKAAGLEVPQSKGYGISLRTWTEPREQFYADLKPFLQSDWPLPAPRPRRVPGLERVEQGRPFYFTEPGTPPPGQETPWVVPEGRGYSIGLRTWTDTRRTYFSEPQPLGRPSLDLPLPARRLLTAELTFLGYYAVDESAPFRSSAGLLVVPERKGHPVSLRTWTDTREPGLVDATPANQYHWPLPAPPLRRVPRLSDIAQARPFYYAEPGDPPPGRATVWVVPDGKGHAIGLRTEVQGRRFYAVEPLPFRQTEWPLVVVPVRRSIDLLSATANLLESTFTTRPSGGNDGFPLPRGKAFPLSLRTVTATRDLYLRDLKPFKQDLWPLAVVPLPSAIDLRLFDQRPGQGLMLIALAGFPPFVVSSVELVGDARTVGLLDDPRTVECLDPVRSVERGEED